MTLPPNLISKLRKKPNTCPYCHESRLDASQPILCLDDKIRMKVDCLCCSQSWIEVRALKTVESVGEYEE